MIAFKVNDRIREPYLNVLSTGKVDEPPASHQEWFAEAFSVIDSVLEAGESLLISCSEGVSRSATLVMAYLMKQRGLSFDEALAAVGSIRPVVNPHAVFVSLLQEYDAILQAERIEAGAGAGGGEASASGVSL